jgi:hypothetical protein
LRSNILTHELYFDLVSSGARMTELAVVDRGDLG